MRIGVLGSSGGSAFGAAAGVLQACRRRHEYVVVTDRACGLESVAAGLGAPSLRLADRDDETLSREAAGHFASEGAELIVLYFLRIVRAPLYSTIPCFNLHPSLLPAFPGLGPLRRAREAGERSVGATLHLVDATLDGGPVVAQTAVPMGPDATEAEWSKRSFLQKVYLTLLLVELWDSGALRADPRRSTVSLAADRAPLGASPKLADPTLVAAFRALERTEGAEILI